jgi:hypothetical protein
VVNKSFNGFSAASAASRVATVAASWKLCNTPEVSFQLPKPWFFGLYAAQRTGDLIPTQISGCPMVFKKRFGGSPLF